MIHGEGGARTSLHDAQQISESPFTPAQNRQAYARRLKLIRESREETLNTFTLRESW